MPDKIFILDTNIIIDDPTVVYTLNESADNRVVIPYSVIVELDRLKQTPGKAHLVSEAIKNITDNNNIIIIRREDFEYTRDNCRDESIISDVKYLLNIVSQSENYQEELKKFIFLSNDQILRFRMQVESDIAVAEYKKNNRFISDAERYTGIITADDPPVLNSFMIVDGKMWSNKLAGIIPNNSPWQLKPRSIYQNAAMQLLLDDEIKVVTIASPSGYGKSILTLSAAFEIMFSKKKDVLSISEELPKYRKRKKKTEDFTCVEEKQKTVYKKIFIVRPTVIVGNELGFLPGDLAEKLDPYFRPIKDLISKLHEHRLCTRIFNDGDIKKGINKDIIEFLPITFLRGMNIENAIVIIDEAQNLSKLEMRTILSRMGENVRCFLTGDTNQVDNPVLNASNNGINWVLRKFKDNPEYAHITLKGPKSRGPITDLVLKTGL